MTAQHAARSRHQVRQRPQRCGAAEDSGSSHGDDGWANASYTGGDAGSGGFDAAAEAAAAAGGGQSAGVGEGQDGGEGEDGSQEMTPEQQEQYRAYVEQMEVAAEEQMHVRIPSRSWNSLCVHQSASCVRSRRPPTTWQVFMMPPAATAEQTSEQHGELLRADT